MSASTDDTYLAMVLRAAGSPQLHAEQRRPAPLQPGQVRLRVHTCAVCRTDLHLVDGELPGARLPRVPGHEIVGTVVDCAPPCELRIGERVGVPWLHRACGRCRDCLAGQENLCPQASFTGYTVDGGFAQSAVAQADYCFRIPARYSDAEAAPLLCAGLIGYRALSMLPPQAQTIGIYGFGAAGHLIAQVALQQGRRVFAFTRAGDGAAQALARELGVHWAGGSTDTPPDPTDGALLFAPVGALVPQALAHSRPGSTVVCAGIHMSDIPSFPYRLLWQERVLRSVANLTRADGTAFFAWAAAHPLRLTTTCYPLAQANRALDDLRAGSLAGAAVLDCS
jgi:propanol-preferring alcohol dehydrogenase